MISVTTARQVLPLRDRLDWRSGRLSYIPSDAYGVREGWAQRMERLMFRLFRRLPT